MAWLFESLTPVVEKAFDPIFGPILFSVIACLVTYAVSRVSWDLNVRSDSLEPKFPPTAPYAIPLLGSIPSIIFDTKKFIHNSTWALKTPNPFAFRLFTKKFFVLQGAANINAFWKKESQMIGMTAQIYCLKYLFGMPKSALDVYVADNSGFNEKPAPKATFNLKIASITSLIPLFWHLPRLKGLNTFDEWIEHPSLLSFFERDFALAVVEASCGSILERENPDFAEDLATYTRVTPVLSKGIPRIFAPKAYGIRDKLLGNIKDWHRRAREEWVPECVEEDGDADPYWGSEFMRSRQTMFADFRGFDADAAASSDLGFTWALIYNIVPTMMWVVLQIHKDPLLRTSIRAELSSFSLLTPTFHPTSIKTLVKLPRLQAVYAECLRLFDHPFIPRETIEEVQVNNWKFPKDSTIVISTHEAQSDSHVWNTGINNSHPIESFWAERFLAYPSDPLSGPILRSAIMPSNLPAYDELLKTELESGRGDEPVFAEKATLGHWIPYGGGARICPGRHFAKKAISHGSGYDDGDV
ncbi:cytochrome P450 [Mollisia scopiformis]|uniref:Cytochrome P450 n=1 Tax=Mollisia scopiformis TaxID=149040 RepID=A0A194X267_MOLSC|nr:cytochrome P450 [Mollisia scopiformis]KUJ14099.1 cytochrome P450 [Mollisia scopiformis]